MRVPIAFACLLVLGGSLAFTRRAEAQNLKRVPGPPVDESFLLNLQTFNTALGVGARPLGMGGAFVAVADDATAASWNPAGLALLLHPEVSIVGESVMSKLATTNFVDTVLNPDNSYQTRRLPGADTGRGGGLSFLSVAYPLRLNG